MAEFKLEAEDAIAVTGYRVERNEFASGDRLLGLAGNGNGEIGSATFAFSGTAGTYDILVGAFDESDGEAQFELTRNSQQLGQVVLDRNPGGTGANADTKVQRTIARRVSLANGDRLTLTGIEEGREHARFDALTFVPVGASPARAQAQSVQAASVLTFLTPSVFSIGEGQRFAADINARSANGDSDANRRLTYRISGGVDNQLCTLDPKTGQLRFTAAPDYEKPGDKDRNNLYTVKVTATDSLGRSGEQKMTVRVKNEREQVQSPGGGGPVYFANQGKVVLDSTSLRPQGDWVRATIDNRKALLYKGPNSFSRALPDQQLEYRFRTDAGGQYFISLYGARDNSLVEEFEADRGNDLFVGIVDAETGEVVQRPTKTPTFLGDANLTFKWGSTFSVKKVLGPATVSLKANTEYRLLLTGRSRGYAFSRVTLSTDRAFRNLNAPESPTRATNIFNPADAVVLEAEDATVIAGNYRLENSSFASGRMLGLRGNGGGELGRAIFKFDNTPGTYDLFLGTFDENDGASRFVVSFRDAETGQRRQLSTTQLDDRRGSSFTDDKTAILKPVATGISLTKGDNISITGFEDKGEGALLDFLQLVPSNI
ncbi:MAG: cadherin repeat domain-containing protein [Cyanobacteria bacterium P01_G01_bin.4]